MEKFIIKASPEGLPSFQIFLDLDGVFANFNQGWERLFNEKPALKPAEEQWEEFIKQDGFLNLPEMPFIDELCRLLTPGECTPYILTGAPGSFLQEAANQKKAWCKAHLELDPDQVIVTQSYLKPRWANDCRAQGVIPILIDDNEKAREGWEKAGGIFVLYDCWKKGQIPGKIRGIEDLCNFTREWNGRVGKLGPIADEVWGEFKKHRWVQAGYVGAPRPYTPDGEAIMAIRFTEIIEWALRAKKQREETERQKSPLVTGDDLILLGIPPGPRLGKMLRRAYEAQMQGERNFKKLLEAARREK